MFGRKKKDTQEEEAEPGAFMSDSDDNPRHESGHSDLTLTPDLEPTKPQLKRATRTRLLWALLTSLLLLISVVFLILVEIGDTSTESIRSGIYFLRLDLANIVPLSYPDAMILNSIAETIGLHDFYHFGLWGFCEGYNGEGVTQCSDPKALYWFNPVEIIRSELLAGATSKSISSSRLSPGLLYYE